MQSDIEDPRFGNTQSFFPYGGSPPLPLLITGYQDPAVLLVPAPELEFGCFRSAYSGNSGIG